MIAVKREGIILEKTDLLFEADSVLNPAVYQDGQTIHIFYRAVRKGNYSTIGYCKLEGALKVVERNTEPLLSAEFDYEMHGVEDPRIVKIEDTFYMTYTAYDGLNALGALTTSTDLKHFERRGVITPLFSFKEFNRLAQAGAPLNEKYQRFHVYTINEEISPKRYLLWDKNVVFFPRKVNGKFFFIHRIKPDIQIACINAVHDLTKEFWEDYFFHFSKHIMLTPVYDHEISYIGGGCPPVETEEGWLIIYHGVHDSVNGYVYTACAALMELNNPEKEIARLPYPLFKPETDWEKNGIVNNVVFPTGTALIDGILYIYYGAGDKCIACASVVLKDLLTELNTYSKKHENL